MQYWWIFQETLQRNHVRLGQHGDAGLQKEIIPYAREIGAGFLAYSPLGRGMLTGKLNLDELSSTDFRRTMNPRFKQDAYDNVGSTLNPKP